VSPDARACADIVEQVGLVENPSRQPGSHGAPDWFLKDQGYPWMAVWSIGDAAGRAGGHGPLSV